MSVVPFNPTREAMSDVRDWQKLRQRTAWGFTAIKDGLHLVELGRPEAGVSLALHGLEFLQKQIEGDNE